MAQITASTARRRITRFASSFAESSTGLAVADFGRRAPVVDLGFAVPGMFALQRANSLSLSRDGDVIDETKVRGSSLLGPRAHGAAGNSAVVQRTARRTSRRTARASGCTHFALIEVLYATLL